MIRMLKTVAKWLLRRGGYEVYRRPYLPKGADPYESLRSHWPALKPKVILDVGANVGQTVHRLRRLFPGADIHAFEPVPETFEQLRSNTARDPRTQVHCLALSDRDGEAWMHAGINSDRNSLKPELASPQDRKVRVTMQTLSTFCASHRLEHVDLLKIDVEGFEMPVLAGARSLLSSGKIDFIIVEAGLMPDNERFTPLSSLTSELYRYGFWLIGVYEQYGDRRRQAAEFGNALFALEKHLS